MRIDGVRSLSVLTRPLTLSDNGASIKLIDSTKGLGLTIDNAFKPSIHFEKTRSVLFLIRRSFVTLTPDIFIPMYSTLVRHHLEYAIQASSPYLKKDVDHLERLQRPATRMVRGYRDLSCEL